MPVPAEQDASEIRRVTWIGLFVNVLLSGLKLAVGIAGSSQAVVADAFHSISDITTDVAVLVGVRYWLTPADDGHPYGHRRIESIVSVGIGVALAGVAAIICYRGISTVRSEHITQPGWIAFVGALVSIGAKETLYRWTMAVGKRMKSSAVRANAWHHRSDALSSIPAAVAVAFAAVNPAWSFVDHMGAVIVAMFILRASWKIMKPALDELSDSGAPESVRARILEAAAGTDEVVDVHAIRTRRMGSGVLVDLHITVDGTMSVLRGHDVSELVKRRIQERVDDVIDVVVHVEPSGQPPTYRE
jgi:cation diffusion facilitator family transporter